ncbi:MAG: tetratricopeptide (TPR) repeat protein [Celeribacter sp.]|jgi:tetratricopeptide (TPR) repeat protein
MNAPLALFPDKAPIKISNTDACRQAQLALQTLVQKAQWDAVIPQARALNLTYPNTPFIHNALGAAYYATHQFALARDHFEHARALAPTDALAYLNLSKSHMHLKNHALALDAAKQAVHFAPQNSDAHKALGLANTEIGNTGAALKALEASAKLTPAPDTLTRLGDVHRSLGAFTSAEQCYTRALTQSAFFTPAHLGLSTVHHYTSTDPHLEAMVHLYQSDLSQNDRRNLGFALAKAFDSIDEVETAFALLADANALHKATIKYHPSKDSTKFHALHTSADSLAQLPDLLCDQAMPIPIFLIGMPRSGTSLTERILSNHSAVIGAGELRYAAQFGSDMVFGRHDINTQALETFRMEYFKALKKHAGQTRYIVDKMPQNFTLLGVIAKAIPEAKIVHVKRDAAATCWSNYKQHFSSPGLQYCYDLGDTVAYYQLYSKLMKRWETQFANRIVTLDYDALTSDPEHHIPRLMSDLGLSMEAACLTPHENTNATATASAVQVRKELYSGSSKRWRRYEPFIGDAFDPLYIDP